MRFCPRRLGWRWGGLCVLLLAGGLSAAEFQVDPDRSPIAVSGNLSSFPVREQAPGSLSSKLAGMLSVDVEASRLTFLEGPFVRVLENGSWEPKPDGEAGEAPACFGGRVSILIASALAAGRDMEFTLASSALELADGAFDAGALQFAFPIGGKAAFDYRVTGALTDSARVPLEGTATNASTLPGTLVTEGTVQTLTIPLDATYVFSLLAENDAEVRIEGTLVATRTLTATPPTFADWILGFFPGETNEAIIGPDANPDFDPWLNFVEYALGLNPSQPEPHFVPLQARRTEGPPGGWIVEYERPQGLPGVGYELYEGSAVVGGDLLAAPEEVVDLGDGRERVTVSLAPPAGTDETAFVRLQVRAE